MHTEAWTTSWAAAVVSSTVSEISGPHLRFVYGAEVVTLYGETVPFSIIWLVCTLAQRASLYSLRRWSSWLCFRPPLIRVCLLIGTHVPIVWLFDRLRQQGCCQAHHAR